MSFSHHALTNEDIEVLLAQRALNIARELAAQAYKILRTTERVEFQAEEKLSACILAQHVAASRLGTPTLTN